MIESELKRKFPGAQFHRIDTSKIDASDRKGYGRFAKAQIHNLQHITYDAAVVTKEVTKLRQAPRSELKRAIRRVDETWADVLATNKALPPKLRGRHTR